MDGFAFKFAFFLRLVYELIFCQKTTLEGIIVVCLSAACAVMIWQDVMQPFSSSSESKITRTWTNNSHSIILSTYRNNEQHGEELVFSAATNSKNIERRYKYGVMVRELIFDSEGRPKSERKFNRFGHLVLLNNYREGLLYKSKSYYIREKRKGFHGMKDCCPGSSLIIRYTNDNPDQTRQVVKKLFHKVEKHGKRYDYYLYYVDEIGKVQPDRPSLQITKGCYTVLEYQTLESGRCRLQTYKGGHLQNALVKSNHPTIKKYRFLEKLDPNLDAKA